MVVSTMAYKNSFQEKMNAKMAEVARPGVAIGSTTRQKAW